MPNFKLKKRFRALLAFLLNQLKEPITWRAIFTLLAAAGYSMTDEQTDAWVVVGILAAGGLGAFSPELYRKCRGKKCEDVAVE